MESVEASLKKQYRVRLILGKFRVLSRNETSLQLALGGSTTMTISVEPYMDVKSGDILTLYTEVFYAKPSQPPVQ